MKFRKIILSSLDHARLRDLMIAAQQFGPSESPILDILEQELDCAKVVPPDEIPPYVVTMNTCFRLTDIDTNEAMKYTLVYPNAENKKEGKLSILSDMGVAIIGFSVGDTIEWNFPEGLRHLRVDMIYFQPEAAKQYEV